MRWAYHYPVKWSAVTGHGLPGLSLIVRRPEPSLRMAHLALCFEDELTMRWLHPEFDDERFGRGERRGESFSCLHLVVADYHVEVGSAVAECGIGLAIPCRKGRQCFVCAEANLSPRCASVERDKVGAMGDPAGRIWFAPYNIRHRDPALNLIYRHHADLMSPRVKGMSVARVHVRVRSPERQTAGRAFGVSCATAQA